MAETRGNRGENPPVALFWGEDEFLLREAASALLAEFDVHADEVAASDWRGGRAGGRVRGGCCPRWASPPPSWRGRSSSWGRRSPARRSGRTRCERSSGGWATSRSGTSATTRSPAASARRS